MGWDDKPPSEEELKSVPAATGWDAEPPKPEELGIVSEPLRNAPIEAGVSGATNELLFGYLPETKAALQTPFSEKNYPDLKKEEYEKIRGLEKDNPEAYTVGQGIGIAGGLLVPFGGEAKAASLIGKIGKSAAIGGAQGLIRNPGETSGEDSSLQIAPRAVNAGLGALGSGAITGLARGAEKIPEVGKGAKDFFIRSLGARPKFFEKATDQKVADLADFAKNTNLVKAGDNIISIADKAVKLKNDFGRELGNLYKSVQSKVDNYISGTADKTILDKLTNATPTVADLKAQILPKIEEELKGTDATSVQKAVANYFDGLEKQYGARPLDLTDLHLIKSKIGQEVDWSRTRSDMLNRDVGFVTASKNVADKINEHMDIMTNVLKSSGDGNLANQLKKLNKSFSLAATAEDLTNKAAAKARGLNRFGLTDTMVGLGLGAGTGAYEGNTSPVGMAKATATGLIGGLLSKTARSYGSPITARVLDSLGTAINKMPAEKAAKISGLIQDSVLTDKIKAQMIERYINKNVMNAE